LFASAAHVILLLCVRRSAPEGVEASSRPGHWAPDARSSGCFAWTPIGSLRSPGDPSCAFAPLLDPGRTDVPLPWRSHRCCPRFERQRRLRTMLISGLTHAASAPALLRFAFRVATHAQGWLPAGWLAFTGRASNPLDHYERFQITWSSPFPVLLTLLSYSSADPEHQIVPHPGRTPSPLRPGLSFRYTHPTLEDMANALGQFPRYKID
jgi:hypothetical protein